MLPSQELSRAIEAEWVSSGEYRIRPEAIQPASIDLRLGDFAWALRCSFLPDVDSTVEEKIDGLAFQRIDLRDGAVLERDRPYLVPLIEELSLPAEVRANANPKSSTGRLDVFTRVITDRHHRFDEIRAGYRGRLYLEIVPRSFAIQVKTGLSLNQLRLARGESASATRTSAVCRPSSRCSTSTPMRCASPSWRSPTGSFSASTSRGRATVWSATGRRRTASRLTSPVCVPTAGPTTGTRLPRAGRADRSGAGDLLPAALRRGGLHPAADRRRDDGLRPDRGELRTHYAGFFDPGFGYDRVADRHGSRAALEVRARDVSFMVEHRQPVCKLGLERMAAPAERLYGQELGSNYQGQVTMLSKHFEEQTGGGWPFRQPP